MAQWRLRRWDAQTGSLLDEVKLSLADDIDLAGTSLSPDGSVLLISASQDQSSQREPMIRISDARTGALRINTVTGWLQDRSMPFSPNGQYFWGNDRNNVVAIATATGKRTLLVPPPRNADNLGGAIFSPDSSALAAIWTNIYSGVFDCVQIFDLVTGKERRRLTLQELRGQDINAWVGNCLYLVGEAWDPEKDRPYLQRSVVDLRADPPGKAIPELRVSAPSDYGTGQGGWIDGLDWVARYDIIVGNRKWGPWSAWLIHWLGTSQPSLNVQLKVINRRTGRESRLFDIGLGSRAGYSISRNGKSVACMADGGIIEVWDIDAPLRWRWALGAGMASAGLVLLVGRWRSRQQQGDRAANIPANLRVDASA
jgi:hypothetical protein